jgi:hypothetical protein
MAAIKSTRKLTILAQDPGVRIGNRLTFTQVEVPREKLALGPVGYRIKVVDFDASANVLYDSAVYENDKNEEPLDPFAIPNSKQTPKARRAWEAKLLSDPAFHAQNAYAIVMRTLARFEFALGRRVSWGFTGHQLHIAPHAFCDANAFYSEEDRALLFGYFKSARDPKRTVFTCLSHDIVAHEATHALLDGLRDGFTDPSTPDQAAFHEGFADVVALLSIFSLPEIVEIAITKGKVTASTRNRIRLVPVGDVSEAALKKSILLGLGKEFGAHMEGSRQNCLRRSIELEPDRKILEKMTEEHDRGEVFAAAMLRSFLALWTRRIEGLGTFEGRKYNLDMVIEEGIRAAQDLLTMAIRALDYCPPVDLSFGDFLASMLTADAEVSPGDQLGYRPLLLKTFKSYGIDPPDQLTDDKTGCWRAFDGNAEIVYNRTNFATMLQDREEVFRFIWENRQVLKIDDRGYTRVSWVRPAVRQGVDGFFLRETVCEYVQVAQLFAAEAQSFLGVQRPEGMSSQQSITAYGGGTLIFDQYGRIKYHIEHRLDDAKRQSERLKFLWENGLIEQPTDSRSQFANIHRDRADAEFSMRKRKNPAKARGHSGK